MEIFQTIWTALTTPNEILTKIMLIPLAFLEAFVSMLFFTTVLNIQTSKKQKINYVLCLGTLTNFINLIIPNPFIKFLLNTILWPIFVILFLKTSILKGILSEVFALILSLCLELLVTNFLQIAFNVKHETIIATPLLRCSFALLINITTFILAITIKRFKLTLKIFDGISEKTKKLLVCNAVLLVLIIISQFYLIAFYNNILPIYITFISIIGLLAYFALSIYSILNISKLAITSRDLKQAQLYNKTLTVLHDNIRAFKHDFHNIVHALGG